MQTDASQSGYGIVIENDWLAGYLDSELIPPGVEELEEHHGHWQNQVNSESFNINETELLPIWWAIQKYSKNWRNRLIRCYTDNTQVAWAINRGPSANKNNMNILRKIFWESVKNNFHLVATHIKGEHNVLPDLLSRLHVFNDLSALNGWGLCCLKI